MNVFLSYNQRKIVYSCRRITRCWAYKLTKRHARHARRPRVQDLTEEALQQGEYENMQERMLRSLGVMLKLTGRKGPLPAVEAGVADFLFDGSS